MKPNNFDYKGMLRFPWNDCTTATATSQKEALTVKDLEKALEDLRGLPPLNWILIAPNGDVYKGEDPMILAARATRTYQL